MQFPEKTTILSSGVLCVLRSPAPADAAAMLAYLRLTAAETEFMLRTPEEVTQSLAEEEAFLAGCLASPRSLMIGAWIDGTLAGSCGLHPVGERRKLLHRAEFGMAVKRTFWGMGIGGLLLDELTAAASGMGYEQLELGVFSKNARARRLYASRGFVETGRIPRAWRLSDGGYDDELLMSRPLCPSSS